MKQKNTWQGYHPTYLIRNKTKDNERYKNQVKNAKMLKMDGRNPESQPVGDAILPPLSLTPEQEELCERLDEFHSINGLKTKPSDMFRGAIFVSRLNMRSNPDWMAQTANSLRDILYPFGNTDGVPNQRGAFRQYGSVRLDPKFTAELGKLFSTLTQLAHHGNGRGSIDHTGIPVPEFEALFIRFEKVMSQALTRQLDVHSDIDQIFANEAPLSEVVDSSTVQI